MELESLFVVPCVVITLVSLIVIGRDRHLAVNNSIAKLYRVTRKR